MQVPYTIYKSINDVTHLLDISEPLFADTETVGLYGKIRLLQLYQEHLDHVIMVEHPDPIWVASTLGLYDTKWHNSHYDITTVQQQTSTRWVPAKFDDTFLLARLHFHDKEKFSLDDTLVYVLGYCPYTKQGLDKSALQSSNWGAPVLTKDQLAYAATDVYFMPKLWHAVSYCKDDFNYKLDMLTLRYCFDFQWNGLPVSKDALYKQYEANQARVAEINLPINANSYVQVRKWLDCTESDGLALATMKLEGNTKAGDILEVRKLLKQNSFLEKFDTIDGRIYGKFQPSARSGRLTSKDQNLQQLPRKLKKAFQAAPGRALWYADYAQIELRSICAIVACKAMEKLFREGADVHGYTAEMLFGKDWTDAQRQLTKTYNFNYLYGGGVDVMIGILIMTAEILIPRDQAVKDRRRWQNLWREIYAWQEKGISRWRKGRIGSTPLGRKYKAKMMTDQLNIENQGCAADVFKLALHYLTPRLKEFNDVYICNVIHDSFIIEGPDDPGLYEPVAKVIAESMQTAWFEVSKSLTIKDLPMPVDVKVGYNWGDIEDKKIPNIFDYNLEGNALCNNLN